MFNVSADIDKQLLRFRGSGMWDANTQARCFELFTAEAAKFKAAGIPFDVVCDLRDFPPQAQEVAAGGSEFGPLTRQMGGRRSAVIVKNAITRMQVSRIAGKLEDMRFFETEDEGLAWLAEMAAA